MYKYILLLHILGAAVWTGGHLILSLIILPRALKNKSFTSLLDFEKSYERVGIPALIIQVITGIYLAYNIIPSPSIWFSFMPGVPSFVGYKLILLFATLVLAADARLRIIPRLSEANFKSLIWHIIPVAIISVLFVLVGVSFRTGGFF